jgi:bifunctional non-homologous end joining protein LigD
MAHPHATREAQRQDVGRHRSCTWHCFMPTMGAHKHERPSAPASTIRFTNLDKVLYPREGITKGLLVAYHAVVADWLLPHLVGRPLTVVRCPDGAEGPCFFQKHHGGGVPKAVRSLPIREQTGRTQDSMVIDEVDGVFGLVQLGTLELHVWGSHESNLEKPDRLVFDLDPDVSLPWPKVVEGAVAMRALLEKLGLESWVKTTGGKGLHVCVPVAPRLGWEDVKAFTSAVVRVLSASAPGVYTTIAAKASRRGRIYLDALRNVRGATAVVPYSPRARAQATVATPITWDELAQGARPEDFTVRTVTARIGSLDRDPWESFRKTRQDITPEARSRLDALARKAAP